MLLLALVGLFAPQATTTFAASSDAASVVFPTYAYAVVSGPYTYDVMLNKAGKETRLSRVGVAGVGYTDIAVQTSPDQQRVAVRLNGSANGGSSLRVIEISSGKSITTTVRSNSAEGVGAFAWSPDGKTLGYTLNAPQLLNADNGSGTVWVVNYDGKWARKVAGKGLDSIAGWSPDGTGVYVTRSNGSSASPQLGLTYYNLNGSSQTVLASRTASRNDPGLAYSDFAVSSIGVYTTSLGAAHVSAQASGATGSLLLASGSSAPASSAASAPFVLAGDNSLGFRSVQGSSEAYSVMSWSPDGYHMIMSGGASGKAWFVDANTGQRWALPSQINNLTPIAWTSSGRYALLSQTNTASTTLITLDTVTGKLVASRNVGKALASSDPVKSLTIPYINQVWDTSNKVSGVWACGPTSVAMILAAYGRLDPWPLTEGMTRNSAQRYQSSSTTVNAAPDLQDGTLYAQYITNEFVYKGHDFKATAKDALGNRVAGLYGSIVGTDEKAHWEDMIAVLQLYDLQTSYIPATWASITAMLDKGYPVVLGTLLTSDGHILVAKGYTKNGFLILNDPYGNKFGASGYGGPDGESVAYPWRKLTAKMAMVVKGTIWTPTPTPSPTSQPTMTSTPTSTPTTNYIPTATPTPPANNSLPGGA